VTPVCDSQFVCMCWWLVWHVSRTQARTVITSKYVSSWRILVRASRNVSLGSPNPIELSYRLERSPLSRNTAVLVQSCNMLHRFPDLSRTPQGEPENLAIQADLIAIESAESV